MVKPNRSMEIWDILESFPCSWYSGRTKAPFSVREVCLWCSQNKLSRVRQ